MNNNALLWIVCFTAASASLVGCGKNDKYDAAGYFEADEITVSSEVSGRITEFTIDEGDIVEAGQSVGAIDSTQLYLNRLQLQKNVRSVISNRPDVGLQTAALEAKLQNLLSEKERMSKLVSANAAPSKQLDDLNTAVDQLRKQIEAQKRTLNNNAASIDAQSSAIDIQIALIDDQLSKCRLTAPASGTVLTTYTHKGEFAVAGKPLYKIADMEVMTLRAYASSNQLTDLKLGQKVQVKTQFGDNNSHNYEGTLVAIASQSEFTPKNIPTDKERADMIYAIKIRVQNDGYIKIGTYAEVVF